MKVHIGGATSRGLRKVTPAHLRAEEYVDLWEGLPDGVRKMGLLNLWKNLSPRALGVKANDKMVMWMLLDAKPPACFRNRSEVGPEPSVTDGLELVSILSNDWLADVTGLDVRSVSRCLSRLSEAGWLAFRDSSTRQRIRYGSEEEPRECFGLDLRPVVTRYQELHNLRNRQRTAFKTLKGVRSALTQLLNRIRGWSAPLTAAEERQVVLAIMEVERVRKDTDLDLLQEVYADLYALAETIEGLIRERAGIDVEAEMESCARDSDVSPYTSGFNQIRESYLGSAKDVRGRPSPPSAPAEEPASPGTAKVPSPAETLNVLERISPIMGLAFSRPPFYRTQGDLVLQYGRVHANKIGLNEGDFTTLRNFAGDQAAAVACLVASLTEGILHPKSYVFGIAHKIKRGQEPVDLVQSLRRLERRTLEAHEEAHAAIL
jgi:hypothetical protein